MSTPRFWADLHLSHKNIYKYRPVFESTLHNNLYFMRVLELTCNKRDTVFFLGDILFDTEHADFIASLPGKKILIAGNHCTEYVPMKTLANIYDEVHALVKYKEFWLSHAPLHPDELRGKNNVHGHVHACSVEDPRYLNVSVDSSFSGFMPRTLHEVRQAFDTVNRTQEIFRGIPQEDCLAVIMSNPISKAAYEYALQESRRITGVM